MALCSFWTRRASLAACVHTQFHVMRVHVCVYYTKFLSSLDTLLIKSTRCAAAVASGCTHGAQRLQCVATYDVS